MGELSAFRIHAPEVHRLVLVAAESRLTPSPRTHAGLGSELSTRDRASLGMRELLHNQLW